MRKKQVSVSGNMIREMIKDVMGTTLGKPFQSDELRKHPVEPAWICPPEFVYELVDMEHFRMEYLRPQDVYTGRVILQLHGGGYIGPLKNIYRRFAVRYSRRSMGGDVLTIDYRVAPEHPYPAALEDAVTAYRWLLDEKNYRPEQIVVAGDSAGGGLTMALCLYLRDHGMPMPGGIIAMSPWGDLTCSGESYVSNYELDPLYGNTKDNILYDSAYIGDSDPMNPYISPVFGEFSGFPPVLLQVGDMEVLLSDTLRIAEKLKTAGVKHRLSVYEGMFHVFQMALELIPESRESWEEVEQFLSIIHGIDRKPEGKVVRRVKVKRRKNWIMDLLKA